jgi:hypothetical protein
MTTSNAGAEFTTKTTIIVVLPGLQGENTLVGLPKWSFCAAQQGGRIRADSRKPEF